MADHVAGTTRVYVRKTLSDSWTDRSTDLHLASHVKQSAGKVTALLLNQSTATGDARSVVEDLHKFWVKVTHEPDGGSETLLWYGNIEDSRIVEPAAPVVEWMAVSIEQQLFRIRMWESYAEMAAIATLCDPISLRPFNEQLEQGATGDEASTFKLTGRCSKWQYHFAEGTLRLAKYTAPEDDEDIAYVFGDFKHWTAEDLIQHLLAVYAPKNGRAGVCPVGFRLYTTTDSSTYLTNSIERWDLKGAMLGDAVSGLVKRAGPLLWWTDATEFDAGNEDFIRLYVGCRLMVDYEDPPQTIHSIATDEPTDSPALASLIRRRVKDRPTRVIARGARTKVMFTVTYQNGLVGDSKPAYERGWDPTLETFYLLHEDDEEESKEKYADVFTKLIIPYDQTGFGSNFTSWDVFLVPDKTTGIDGDKILVRDNNALDFYPHPRELLGHNPTYRAWINPTNNDYSPGVLPRHTSNLDPGQGEHDPILAWFVPDTVDAHNKVYPVTGLRRLQDEPGVRLPLRYRGFSAETPVMLSIDDNWQKLKITVCIETDQHLTWSEPATDWDDDQCRIEIIDMPECEWWAARSGTIIDIDADGTETEIYGVLRNDLPLLEAAARKRMALLNQDDGAGRVRPLYQGEIPLKWPSLTYGVGDFIENYGPYPMDAVIMTVRHELRDKDIAGTTLVTHKAAGARDAP